MTDQPANRIVWAEIPAKDLARAKGFYEAVLEQPLKLDESGPNPAAFLPYPGGNCAAGHLYPGKPAAKGEGATVHITVDSELPAAMKRVEKAGGEVTSDVITIPAGSFFYAYDTEGNSIGLFKA